MSNWFEESPTRSVILHTILVAGTVWAVFTFVFDENKVSVFRAQAENEKATAGQYKAKTEVLEVEISRLRDENKKYQDWLTATPNSIPYFETKLKALTEENSNLQQKLATPASTPSGNATTTPEFTNLPYVGTKTLSLGEAYVDPKTNVTIGIGKISPSFTATGSVTLPGQDQKNFETIKSGDNWIFPLGKKQYQLTVLKVDWFSNKSEVMVKEIEDQK
ncbi:hypothetical protein [Pseudomonas mandelii]|uniref:Uncharacterized protein n=1 Tax=Pseudomonas mandelii TaxID=75612 RepID=A0ABY0VVK6_9PSED|nr:hypothetical protein [Pseudomonas mandelii]TWS07970.1 hypothetical protein FJD35_23980 [Pseudomonas mandelii]SDU58367.1 hypothetical protein SAMN04489801_4717 [Pseudomonas mandelii]